MKKTIAVIGSAAALSFAGAGLAMAQEPVDQTAADETTQTETTDDATTDDAIDEVETPAEVSAIAEQLCGTISAYDFLGSAEGVVPGLSGEECEANATAAVGAAFTGDIAGAIDILRGIDAETPGDGDETEGAGSTELLGSLTGGAEGDDTDGETEQPAFGS